MPQVTIGISGGRSFDEQQLDTVVAGLQDIAPNELRVIRRHCEDNSAPLSPRATNALNIKGLLQDGELPTETQVIVLACVVSEERGVWVRQPTKRAVIA